MQKQGLGVIFFFICVFYLNSSLAAPNVFINEIHYDNAGTDAGEAIEVAGVAGTDLTGWSLVLYNGNGGFVYNTTNLNASIPEQQNGYGTVYTNYPTNGLQNGSPDGVALVDNGGNVVQFLSYEGSFIAVDGPAVGLTSIDISVAESSDTPIGNSLQLVGVGGSYYDFTWSSDSTSTFGSINTNQVFTESNGLSFIHDIQGNSETSPLEGKEVTIEGIVVGDFQTVSYLGGFFVQEEDSDTDGSSLTSEGIFVYDGSPVVDVNVGDIVRVTGTVAEYYSLTELQNVTVSVMGTGVVTPTNVTLPMSSLGKWEQYEGMLIQIAQPLYVSDNYNQGRYGEVELSVNNRLFTPTNVVSPGAPALALQNLNDRSRIQLDDGSKIQNPILTPYLGNDNTLRIGDTIPSLEGVLSYSFGTYEVHPTLPVNFTRVNERQTIPDDVGNSLKIASFNVLNYFTTIDDGSYICGPLSDSACRGADTPEEFTRQRDKILAAITTLGADVTGIIEIENHPNDSALSDLVDGLNDIEGIEVYDYIATGVIGTDAIKVAIIYKPEKVIPVGSYSILNSTVNPIFLDTKNRPSLAQTFEQTDNGEKFTVVVNHFKSKGSSCYDVGDPDLGDGQENCNLTRTNAASALVDWLATDPTGSEDTDYLIIGDLNSYAKEDPITVLKSASYFDLLENAGELNPYSYVYLGQSGCLDYAFVNNTLMSQVTGVSVWHINADEPSALDYNDYNQPNLYSADAYRSSDHDPIVIGLHLAQPKKEGFWILMMPAILSGSNQ